MTDPLNISPEQKMENYKKFSVYEPIDYFGAIEPVDTTPKPPVKQFINPEVSYPTSTFVAPEASQEAEPKPASNSFIAKNNNIMEQLRNRPTIEKQEEQIEYDDTPYVSDNKAFDFNTFQADIKRVESGGKYTATNPNSSAAGAYQFLFKSWGKEIQQVTGIKTKQEFLNNPKAQDHYFKYYTKKHVEPQIKQIRKEFPDTVYSDLELAKLIHFQGAKGARDSIRKKNTGKRLQSYNMSVDKYLKA